MTQEADTHSDAKANAAAWLETIRGYVARIEGEDQEDADQAREEAEQSPLSVEVRGGWYSPGSTPDQQEEYRVLLSTGGPALQLTGSLNKWGEPDEVSLQWQHWGTPWTDYRLTEEEEADVLTFARIFYFGE